MQTASFAMGSEPNLKLTLPGSCGTFIFPQFFSLSLMSQEQFLPVLSDSTNLLSGYSNYFLVLGSTSDLTLFLKCRSYKQLLIHVDTKMLYAIKFTGVRSCPLSSW